MFVLIKGLLRIIIFSENNSFIKKSFLSLQCLLNNFCTGIGICASVKGISQTRVHCNPLCTMYQLIFQWCENRWANISSSLLRLLQQYVLQLLLIAIYFYLQNGGTCRG